MENGFKRRKPSPCPSTLLQEALLHGSKLQAALLELNFPASWQHCCQGCQEAHALLQEALQHAAKLQAALLELNFPTAEQHYCQEAGEEKERQQAVCERECCLN